MSSFLHELEARFAARRRARGLLIQRDGRVTDFERTENGFRAEVRSEDQFEVDLPLPKSASTNDGPTVDAEAMRCECGTFDSGEPCEHLWAALLELDDRWIEYDEPAAPAPSRSNNSATRIGSEVRYRIDLGTKVLVEKLVVDVEWRKRSHGDLTGSASGWGPWTPLYTDLDGLLRLADSADRELIAKLFQAMPQAVLELEENEERASFPIAPEHFEDVLQRLRATGRAWVRRGVPPHDERSLLGPLFPTPTYELEIRVERIEAETGLDDQGVEAALQALASGEGPAEGWRILATLVPATESDGPFEPEPLPAGDVAWFHPAGLIGLDDGVLFKARLGSGDVAWLERLEGRGELFVPATDPELALAAVWSLPQATRFEVPDELALDDATGRPTPVLRLRLDESPSPMGSRLGLSELTVPELIYEVWFEYGVELAARDSAVDEGEEAAADTDSKVETAASAPPVRRQFRYGGSSGTALDVARRVRLHRDVDAERAYVDELDRVLEPYRVGEAGTSDVGRGHGSVRVAGPRARMLSEIFGGLSAAWLVTLGGERVHRVVTPRFQVTSGIDWFELDRQVEIATVDGTTTVDLPVLLQAAHGDQPLRVGDGQVFLDEETRTRLSSLGSLVAEGDNNEEGVRLGTSQLFVLDALMRSGDREFMRLELDDKMRGLRESLESFEGIQPVDPPESFHGELRDYQKIGLGWLWFLRERGLGGCLADDMGLGKTVQVLALFDGIRELGPPDPDDRVSRPAATADAEDDEADDDEAADLVGRVEALGAAAHPASTPKARLFLVVAPKSVVPNWIGEAHRFAPGLEVLDFTGADRQQVLRGLEDAEGPVMLVTTYSVLRIDIRRLLPMEFDTVVLDEAQAIKNPQSKTAQAARRLVARHRLALTGTPVENHLGDAVSIFRFLNPGMVEHLPSLRALSQAGEPDDALQVASAALRPLVLRRTKDEVLEELPEKTEQTLYSELSDTERTRYDELAAYYRQRILSSSSAEFRRSKFIALEALLRLRQAASHQGLLPAAQNESGRPIVESSKLDLLDEMVEEVLEEHSHKALVFSQFTSLLAYVRERFDARGWRYAYLDGGTRNRDEVVREFQEDPECRLFLISLKAGGVGLNLTAADYVFLLDPWWNPAVEQQAIDRAHRIGQTRPVVAYRLLTRDTVEERVAALQETKRELADALLGPDKGLVAELTKEDMEILLS